MTNSVILILRKLDVTSRSWYCTRRKSSKGNLLRSIDSDIAPSINRNLRSKKKGLAQEIGKTFISSHVKFLGKPFVFQR